MEEANRVFNNQRGFTFLELLLVLSIVLILTAVILPFSEKRLQRISEEDALKQFITTVHETQLYAITHQESVSLIVSGSGSTYKTVRDNMAETVISGEFPEGMRQTKNSTLKRLDFAASGYLVKTGVMTFTTKSKGEISILFQFERGRMVVK